jgi:hypothetical protein
VVAAGNRPLLETAPAELDRELRTAMPPGTPRATVEATLRDRHLQYIYRETLHLLEATAPDLKGSNPLRETSLHVDLQFDANGSLKKIDSRVVRSGL